MKLVMYGLDKRRMKQDEFLLTEHVPKLCQVVSTCLRTQSSIAFQDMSALISSFFGGVAREVGVPYHPPRCI